MGRQSSRIFFQGKDHKEIYFQGHYHKAMYIGATKVWEKLAQGLKITYEVYSNPSGINGTAFYHTDGYFYFYDLNSEGIGYSELYRTNDFVSYEKISLPQFTYLDSDNTRKTAYPMELHYSNGTLYARYVYRKDFYTDYHTFSYTNNFTDWTDVDGMVINGVIYRASTLDEEYDNKLDISNVSFIKFKDGLVLYNARYYGTYTNLNSTPFSDSVRADEKRFNSGFISNGYYYASGSDSIIFNESFTDYITNPAASNFVQKNDIIYGINDPWIFQMNGTGGQIIYSALTGISGDIDSYYPFNTTDSCVIVYRNTDNKIAYGKFTGKETIKSEILNLDYSVFSNIGFKTRGIINNGALFLYQNIGDENYFILIRVEVEV